MTDKSDFFPLRACPVPLKYMVYPDHPVDVDFENQSHKVGVSPLWSIGKTALGMYLPWRFGHGEPL